MRISLTPEQEAFRKSFRQFAVEHIAPHAAEHDQEERVSRELIHQLAQYGYLGSFLPLAWSGLGLDMITYGLLHEELGKKCSSIRCLLTVHDMVALSIQRWGSEHQRLLWLPRMARGKAIGAFAITEPSAGSDANGVETTAVYTNGCYVLDGTKKWITFGQIADLFLVLTKVEGKTTAFLVERDSPGLSIKPISGMLGMRGAMLAELHFDRCIIPEGNMIGRPGFGLTSVAFTALGLGRYSIAWGSVAIAQACLEACLQYAARRRQFKVFLKEHQLIQRMIAEMISNISAARLLCYQAGYLKDHGDPREIKETFIAKYFGSTVAMKVACDAVQIHGANGCSKDYPVERYLRDAKIMEIIEGSSQIQQITIAKFGFQEFEHQMAAEENLSHSMATAS